MDIEQCMIGEELDRYVEPVQFADWDSPIVPVLKSAGKELELWRL